MEKTEKFMSRHAVRDIKTSVIIQAPGFSRGVQLRIANCELRIGAERLDHVHVLVEYDPNTPINSIVKAFKGRTLAISGKNFHIYLKYPLCGLMLTSTTLQAKYLLPLSSLTSMIRTT